MNIPSFKKCSRAGMLLCTASLLPLFGSAQAPRAAASPEKSIISLVQDQTSSTQRVPLAPGEASFENAPANFHAFSSARVGEVANVETLTLRFSASTKLTKIESTKDFKIEQGSSCVAGKEFSANDTCRLLVRFTPQGAGRRLGKMTIAHSASPEAYNLGLGGYGYAPVLSFTPALITKVPGTFPSNVGLLSGAQNLAVDGSDTLYIPDTGNGLLRYINSSGAITTLASGYSGLLGVAVDTFGEVYFDVPSTNDMYEIYGYGPVVTLSSTTAGACTVSAPCTLAGHAISHPAELSIDPYNHLFWADADSGAAFSTVQPTPASLIYLYDPFPFQQNPSAPMAVDSGDNLYSLWANGGVCALEQQSLYNAENSYVSFNKVAGGHACGFSGDGGQAGNAEIGAKVGQIAFDIAGNLYFTDTNNQRARRIDATTGIINTIAGNGTVGSGGGGGPATGAQLSTPTGITVDSQGQVYIISSLGSGQMIWKLGPNGFLSFPSQAKGSVSPASTVTVSNTGNSAMSLTNYVINGANPGDFAIDPGTTSCMLTAGSSLAAGQSCKIGIVFKPSASGTRTANLVMLDNTVTNSNTIQLFGTGTLPLPTFSITSPTTGTSVAAGTAITFKVSVTSSGSPQPTGTVKMLLDGGAISGSPATIASGVASLSVTTSVVGSHTLSATYNGDANYAASGPITRTYTVTSSAMVPTKVSLKSSSNPTAACSALTFTATVTDTKGVKPTGDVLLMNGSTLMGTGTLKNGTVKLSTTALKAGTSTLTAKYSGDTTHEPSTSSKLKQVVKGSAKANSCK